MTTTFAIGVLAVSAGAGLSLVWWMFSGAAAWMEPDAPEPLSRVSDEGDEETHDD